MPELGAPELLIIFAVVVLVFGGSRMAELGGSLGKGIKEFKKAMKEDEPEAAGSGSSVSVSRTSDNPSQTH